MSTVTTHVLDTALGRPAAGIQVRLERLEPAVAPGGATSATVQVAAGVTDADGRITDLGPDDLGPGVYRLVFDTATYFAASEQATFFPEVSVVFDLTDPALHHHVPVLLSPFAYSTYRGS